MEPRPAAGAGPSARFPSASAEGTRELGARLGRMARPGDVIALSGDLGAGKTCFIQGVAAGLGVASVVTSPTFVLVAEYAGRLPLHHVDLYRTESLEEIRALGLEELLDGEGVTVIEWAEKAEPLLPPRSIRVRIEGVGDEPRTIELQGLPPGGGDSGA
ncbi:MAG TPA: tRNA (adenosine(37)-N6)-threonylcarbamoyltransferase complex ATPase subunit type 1 TsaE [Methylomirabilota bacterium]|nr:tRNA (adenosine(37)-N6)-threonylcarbamoyltransferase complex ATPase subunit type 1 TsaE [Methylomirabilota bacterium]